MAELLGFLWGFSPWILFGIMAEPPLQRLELAVMICLALSLASGAGKLRKGFVLTWGTVVFFVAVFIAVNLLKNVWAMKHLGVLANGSLALIAWGGLILGKPFVLQYAKEATPREFWDRPELLRAGTHLTVMWGLLFLLSTGFALYKQGHRDLAPWVSHLMGLGPVAFGVTYTQIYKGRARRQRELAMAGRNPGTGTGN
ncbi:MAG: hypothetical protein AB1921_11835 [Thermodesulfobacteriota bacterium]